LRDKSEINRVVVGKHDRNGRCCRLGCTSGLDATERCYESHSPPGQVRRHVRQPVVSTFSPAVFNRNVLPFDVPVLLHAEMKGGDLVAQRPGRTAGEIPHQRHRLLRTRRHRPRCGCAAKERDEVAPFHSNALSG
jgi:hypothetical protein